MLNSVYSISDDVVAREIGEDIIIVPITSGIGDMEEELYSLNTTGKVIWDSLNGINSVETIINMINNHYDAPDGEIEKDVVGLIKELDIRKIITINQS